MELFEFKRYSGDTELGNSEKSDLNEYLEKVKARKRNRQEENVEESSEVLNASGPSFERGKRDKRKKDILSSSDPLSNYLDGVAARKKRRETREQIHESPQTSTIDESVVEDRETKKKERKSSLSVPDDELLANLVPKIKKKDRKSSLSLTKDDSESNLDSNVVDSLSEDRPSNKKKGKKLNNLNDKSERHEESLSYNSKNDDKSIDPTQDNDVEEEPTKKRKKKKKKKKVKSNDEVLEEHTDHIVPLEKKEVKPVAFEILGAHEFKDKVKVKRVLPRWLSEPTVISAELASGTSVKDIGKLHKTLLQNLESMGIKELFPVQLAVIPYQFKCNKNVNYLWSRDLCVSAPTGSGKTLAYVLPILQSYYELSKSSFYALVVVPVQELALQVTKVFKDVAKGTGIKIACVTGGTDREAEAKTLVLKREDNSYTNIVNILVATPGRLMEHFFLTPGFSVKNLKYIVIDEADRIVEQKSLNWLHLIEKTCNPDFSGTQCPVTFYNLVNHRRGPQKLLFSATLSQDPEKLLKLNLFQPKLITSVVKSKQSKDKKDQFLGKFTTPSSLKENYVVCEIDKKPLLVHKLLVDGWRSVLIFAKSCVEANRLCQLLKFLNPAIKIDELTSLMILRKRQLVVKNFSQGLIEVLVCSDRLARGIDIKGVDYVIIYDPPKYAKGYIHKAGRTGRAGVSGTALSILTPKQSQIFLQMLNKAGKSDVEELELNILDLEQYNFAYTEALKSLKTSVVSKKNSALNHILKEKRSKSTFNVRKRKRVI